MHDETLTPDDRDFVTALASGLEVILAFDEAHPRMTLSEVASRTGMNRARARRFLLTLHALGYVRKQQRHFELAPKVLSLGYAFLSANQLPQRDPADPRGHHQRVWRILVARRAGWR